MLNIPTRYCVSNLLPGRSDRMTQLISRVPSDHSGTPASDSNNVSNVPVRLGLKSKPPSGHDAHVANTTVAAMVGPVSDGPEVRWHTCRYNETAETVHDFRNILCTVSMLSGLALMDLAEMSPVSAKL